MAYSVKLSGHAVRAYKKLDPFVASNIREALDSLQHSPLTGPKIKRLTGRLRDYFRYREGTYRIAYTVDPKEHTVYVDYIQYRKDVYKEGMRRIASKTPSAPDDDA